MYWSIEHGFGLRKGEEDKITKSEERHGIAEREYTGQTDISENEIM